MTQQPNDPTFDPTALAGRSGAGRLANLAIMGVVALVIIAIAFVTNGPSTGATSTTGGGVTSVTLNGTATGPAPVIGEAAPEFSAVGADGKAISLSQFKGHPVWVTFGASWCQPCRAENPDVVATYEQHRGTGLVVIQIYMSEDAAAVNSYADRVGIPYVKVPDPDQRLADEYRIVGIPTHFFLDSSGVLRSMKIGSLTPGAMDTALKEIGG